MKPKQRVRAIWGLAVAALAVAAIVVPLVVLAGSSRVSLTIEAYADLVRFEAPDVAALRIQIYDLSEKLLWDSGETAGGSVDWDRTDDWGERLANGYYLYLAQAWDLDRNVVLKKTGRLALLPGDRVLLQTSSLPSASGSSAAYEHPSSDGGSMGIGPKAVDQDHSSETWAFKKVGIGTTSPIRQLDVSATDTSASYSIRSESVEAYASMFTSLVRPAYLGFGDVADTTRFTFQMGLTGNHSRFSIGGNNFSQEHLVVLTNGTVGIGTTAPTARLTVKATDSSDLIAAYSSSGRVFVVENDGDVRADGSFYGASFDTGGADVAERINVTEWVEPGNVVEIDPEHPGCFRKSSVAYSRKVAGIVSTLPGVVLGNKGDSTTDCWSDNRPALAIAGRVPVYVTAENGPIRVGDLLVASSVRGAAMRGDPAISVGAVVGKAMETLETGEGTIMAQIVLR